ncbi:MAG: PD-(D/E)XK nuclease family protein [Gemmatimonadetes bacterium]|nr:PD-(D/E)XK nuclease family protein [Gemmatimonadota bacterium]
MSSTRLQRSRLVDALAEVARAHPLSRKLVVAPSVGGGRELLRRLGREGRGWIGFEVTTVRPLAVKLAGEELDTRGLQLLDPFEQQALMDEALDVALSSAASELRDLSEGVGFRESVHRAVDELRLAGLSRAAVDGARGRSRPHRRLLGRVLGVYEGLLDERRRVDTADILRMAVAVLGSEDPAGPALGAEVVLLVPGLGLRGLRGELVDGLLRRGARVLPTDPAMGLEVPPFLLWESGAPASAHAWLHAPSEVPGQVRRDGIELFRAASVNDELREVLRRVVARGLPWDEVEVVTPDPATYGSALHALSVRLGIPVTYAAGLPVERTRAGRVAHAYLDWIAEGFQASPIRRLLEAGDLRAPPSRRFHAPADLARRFRTLRIGWGRHRYRTQIGDALAALGEERPTKADTAERLHRRVARVRSELGALRRILYPTLKATPSVPDRAGEGGGPVSPAELAGGLRAFLKRVPRGDGPEAVAREEILRVLDRVEATLRRRTHFDAAVTILRRHLDIKVRTPESISTGADDRGAPRRSEGGHLHLVDIEHGAYSGRKAIFVVGVDADHVPGGETQDPALPDSHRRALGTGLATAADRMREDVFRFAAFFARARGQVTLSYGAWDASVARSVAPSPVLLQALRLARRSGDVSFRDLHEVLGPVACALPGGELPALDADDVWMKLLGSGGVLRTGVPAVRRAYPWLDAGLSAARERTNGEPGVYHGVVTSRPEDFDPRRNPSLVVSASRLEALGACPHRYLHQSVLRVRPPDDPEFDPDRWLDPLQRGSLLHAVYEGALRRARQGDVEYEEEAFERLALEVLEGQVRPARLRTPAPGEGVARREVAGLQEDVRSFVRMVRERGARWVALELSFGLGDDDPVVMHVPGGQVRLRGAVDRVDEGLEGLRIVDYKTGRSRDHQSGTGAFNGGRRLQHALYAEAVERRLGGTVVAGEYHFPTRRGENSVHAYARLELAGAPELVGHMLDGVAAGAFVPTDNADDCRYCDFAAICRAKKDEWGKADSPLAEWSKEHLGASASPAFRALENVRGFEG